MSRRADQLLFSCICLGLLSWLAVEQSSAGWSRWFPSRAEDLVKQYDLINSQLVDLVRDEAATPNLLIAVDWLKMVNGELALDPSDLVLPSKKALIQFTSLLKLMDPESPNCNMMAYHILMSNEQATGSQLILPPEEAGALRRIETVIHEVAAQHARMCRYEYPHRFASALVQLDKQTLRDIRSMMKALIATSERIVFKTKDRVTDPRQFAAEKAKGVSMRGWNEALALLAHMRTRTRDDTDNRYLYVKPDPRRRKHWIVDEGKVVELLTRYVYSRCEYLLVNTDEVMRPALLEQNLYSKEHQYRAINDITAEFMIWMRYHEICLDAMKNKEKLENNIIKAIWKEL